MGSFRRFGDRVKKNLEKADASANSSPSQAVNIVDASQPAPNDYSPGPGRESKAPKPLDLSPRSKLSGQTYLGSQPPALQVVEAASPNSPKTSPLQKTESSTASTTSNIRTWYDEQWKIGRTLALERLSERQRQLIHTCKDELVDAVVSIAEQAKELFERKRWKFDVNGKTVVVADQVERILRGMDKYSLIVDIAVPYGPSMASVVWGTVRSVMKVCQTIQWGRMFN